MYRSIVKVLPIIVLAVLGLMDGFRMSREPSSMFAETMGPDLYLKLLSAIMLIACAVFLWRAFRNVSGTSQRGASVDTGKSVEGEAGIHPGLVAVIFLLYVGIALVTGYLIASVLFFCSAFYLFGLRPWFKAALIGVGTAAAFYVCFVYLIGVELPKGLLALVF